MVKLTPAQERLEYALSDGMPHYVDDLYKALDLGYGPGDIFTLRMHVSNLRKKIKVEGKAILCMKGDKSKTYYQLVHVLKV